MGVYYDFDEVDIFTLGAVGLPGQRMFLLQVRRGTDQVTVKCEKQQAGAIADYLRKVLHDLPPAEDQPLPAALALAAPADPVFVLGPIGLGYEPATDRVLVQLDELVPVDDTGEPDPELVDDRGRVRIFLTRGQVQAFVEHANALVAAGRPNCRWCGGPVDPTAHICPRMN